MSWNYRIINEDGCFGVHGVYYDDAQSIRGMDQDPNAPTGESLEHLRATLQLMLEALEKPILDYKEYNQ